MKKVLVKYIVGDFRNKEHGKIVDRFLAENEKDLQLLKDSKIIGTLQLDGMRKSIARGEQLIVNENGGYCNTTGTWEIIKRL